MNLLTIQTLNDETIARSFLAYENIELATSALYSTMASALVSENVIKVMCELIGDNGTVCKMEYYDKTIQPIEKE